MFGPGHARRQPCAFSVICLVGNMATKRHLRRAFITLMVVALVCPPLTGAIAAGFGLDLAHHHCDDHGVETLADHDEGHDRGHGPEADHHVKTGNHDPFQCDQCDIAFVALPAEIAVQLKTADALPTAQDMLGLRAADPPLAFKPPIT